MSFVHRFQRLPAPENIPFQPDMPGIRGRHCQRTRTTATVSETLCFLLVSLSKQSSSSTMWSSTCSRGMMVRMPIQIWILRVQLYSPRSTTEKSSLETNVHWPGTSCTHRFLADQKEIIIFANRQNFSIEMFAGNVALSKHAAILPKNAAILAKITATCAFCRQIISMSMYFLVHNVIYTGHLKDQSVWEIFLSFPCIFTEKLLLFWFPRFSPNFAADLKIFRRNFLLGCYSDDLCFTMKL